MKWIREHCHVIDHPRLTDAGAIGRDLWHWGMLFAGKHETDGAIPMGALLATPWGAGGKKNIIIATKLVGVGLWERTETGFKICRWSEMGNPSKAELEDKRREEREGRKDRRKKSVSPEAPSLVSGHVSAPDNSECPPRTPEGVPYSYSEELTGRKDPEVSRGPASVVQAVADPLAAPPCWLDGVLETVHMSTGVLLPKAESWVRYAGHRASKAQREGRPYPPTREDAAHWLSTVMVKEAREARDKAHHQRDRESKWDKDREKQRDAAGAPQPYHQPYRPPPTEARASPKEQAEAMKKLTAAIGKTGS